MSEVAPTGGSGPAPAAAPPDPAPQESSQDNAPQEASKSEADPAPEATPAPEGDHAPEGVPEGGKTESIGLSQESKDAIIKDTGNIDPTAESRPAAPVDTGNDPGNAPGAPVAAPGAISPPITAGQPGVPPPDGDDLDPALLDSLQTDAQTRSDSATQAVTDANQRVDATGQRLESLYAGPDRDNASIIQPAITSRDNALSEQLTARINAQLANRELENTRRFAQLYTDRRAANAAGDRAKVAEIDRLVKEQFVTNEGQLIPADDSLRVDAARYVNQKIDEGKQNEVGEVVKSELEYATQDLAMPEKQLDGLIEELKARRPGDTAFAGLVERIGKGEFAQLVDPNGQPVLNDRGEPQYRLVKPGLLQDWQGAGRSPDVMQPLIDSTAAAVGTRDWSPVTSAVLTQFDTRAETSPSVRATELFGGLMSRYGPAHPLFQKSRRDAQHEFLEVAPQRFGAELAQVYDNNGNPDPVAASEKLREGSKDNPLSAALNLNAARETIDKVTAEFPTSRAPGMFGAAEDSLFSTVYSNLSYAAENASLSPEGQQPLQHLATGLRPWVEGNWDGARSAIGDASQNGSGNVLSLESAYQLASQPDGRIGSFPFYSTPRERANQIVGSINPGFDSFEEDTVRPAAGTLVDRLSYLTEPREQFGPNFTTEQIAEADRLLLTDPNPPAFLVEAGNAHEQLEQSRYKQLLGGIKRYTTEEAGATLGGLSNFGALQDQLKGTGRDPLLNVADIASDPTRAASIRLVNSGVVGDGRPVIDPLEVQNIYDRALAMLPEVQRQPGNPWARSAAITAAITYPSLIFFSGKFRDPQGNLVTYDPRAWGLVGEQAPRALIIGATAQDPWFDNKLVDLGTKVAANDATALAFAHIINNGFNKGPVRIPALGQLNPGVWYVPPHILAGRLASGPGLALTKGLVINPLQANGTLPTPKIGQDGRPVYDNLWDWTTTKLADTANWYTNVAVPNGVAFAYSEGARTLIPGGKDRAVNDPIRLKEVIKHTPYGNLSNPGFFQALRSGARTGLRVGNGVGAMFAAGYLASEFVLDRPLGDQTPPVMDPLQGGPIGTAASAATLGGFAAWSLPFERAKAIGKKSFWAGTLTQLTLNELDRDLSASRYEDANRYFLRSVGVEPGVANVLADHSPTGQSAGEPLRRVGVDFDKLKQLDPNPPVQSELASITRAASSVRRDDHGQLIQSGPMNLANNQLGDGLVGFDPSVTFEDILANERRPDNRWRSSSNLKPLTLDGLKQWFEIYHPELLRQ